MLLLNGRTLDALTIFFSLIACQLIGIVLLLINTCYLKWTRGYTSVRWEPDQCHLGVKRHCKIRNAVACNLLIIYHIILVIVELILGISQLMGQFSLVYFGLAIVGYIIICTLCLPISYITGGCRRNSNVGPVNACIVWECFNSIIFLGQCLFMISCCMWDCSADVELTYSSGFITTGIIYMMLLIGAWSNYSSFQVYTKIISKEEVVIIVKRKLSEAPYIQWVINCNLASSAGKSKSSLLNRCSESDLQ